MDNPDVEKAQQIYLYGVCVLGTATNTVILIVISANRKLQNIPNMYLAALAIVGIFDHAFILPLNIIFLKVVPSFKFCHQVFSLQMAAYVCNILILLAMAVERALFVFRPLKYYTTVTRRRTLVVILLISIYSPTICFGLSFVISSKENEALDSILKLFEYQNITMTREALSCAAYYAGTPSFLAFATFGNLLPAISASIVINTMILCLAHAQSRAINRQQNMISLPDAIPQRGVSSSQKCGIWMLLVNVIYMGITWIPMIVSIGLNYPAYRSGSNVIAGRAVMPLELYIAQVILASTVTIVGPCLCAAVQREFRMTLKNRCCRWKTRNRTDVMRIPVDGQSTVNTLRE